MRTVGNRSEQPLQQASSGSLLKAGARFNETISHLSPSTFIPKGVYRFKNHAAANQHWQDCLVQGMATLAIKRG